MEAQNLEGPAGSGEWLIRTWGVEHGLPENSATAMVQSADGYLWFGTFNGLVRFNGHRFTVFNPANTPQLPSVGIVNLHADKRDRLWVSTGAGLVVKDGDQWRLLGTNEGWAGNFVRTFAERANGDLLITTFDGHVLAVENDRLTSLPPPPGEPGHGYLGTVDESGKWWLAQNRFVGFWNGQRWIQVHAPSPALGRSAIACATARGGGVWALLGKELLKFRGSSEAARLSLPQLHGGIWSMSEDTRSNLWICSYDSGLFQVTPGGELSHWTTTTGLGTKSTRVVFEDREENLWIGTSGDGLRRLTRQRFFKPGSGSPGSPARSVSPARDGGMWMAFYDAGLFRQDERGTARVFVPGPSEASGYGLSVLEDRAGRLWYGDVDYCWWRRGQDRFEKVPLDPSSEANVSSLFEDSKGRVWIGSRASVVVYDGHGFQPLGPETGLPRGAIVGFGEDQTGVLWVAGSEGVFRQEQNQFTAVRGPDGQPLQGVLCFKADADGGMWMGTRAHGLIRWRNGKQDRIGAERGLPDLEVRGFIEDEQGYFWMPSNRGIIRASRKQLHAVADGDVARLEFQWLDQHDGLPSPECSLEQPGCARDTAGKLWFATRKGVAVIDPAGFRLNSRPPPVRIEQLTYRVPTAGPNPKTPSASGNGGVRVSQPFPKLLRLPPGSHGLDIEFAVLSFNAPEKVRFQYLLEGDSRDWQETGNDRVVRFHQLPPRDYVFRVRASNNDGVWNETGASLSFIVRPFFWQTNWFRFLLASTAVGVVALSVWGIMRGKLRQQEERLAAQRALRESEERLMHASRLAMMGELTATIAHEVNQPLGAILSNADAAEMLLEGPSPDLDEIRLILSDIRKDDLRASEVIRRIRTLLRKRELQKESLNVNEVISEVLRLVHADAQRRGVAVESSLRSGLPSIDGDRVHLQQVLLNLILNGMDAMAETPVEKRCLVLSTLTTHEGGVEVTVKDSGHGIPADKLPRVFDSFFTTKPEGMGLGLAIARSIIEAHGGRIWAENNPDGGATFGFRFPRDPKTVKLTEINEGCDLPGG